MTMRQLSVFKTVCEELSFTRAASKLYMTQPAVSHIIGELEEETGLVLFDRLGKRIYVSREGKIFFQKAVRLLELYAELESGGEEIRGKAPVRIGSSITIANFWLPPVLKRLSASCPDTPVNILVESAGKISSLLDNNEIDLALIEGTVRGKRFQSITFSSYQVRAYCSPDYPLPAVPMTAGRLVEEKLLLREKGSAVRDVLDSALTLLDLSAEPCFTSVNSQALIQAAACGLGIAFLPDILARIQVESGFLREVLVEGLFLKNENHAVFHRDKALSRPLELFLQYISHCETFSL